MKGGIFKGFVGLMLLVVLLTLDIRDAHTKEVLGLSDVFERALKNAERLKISEEDLRIAESSKDKAYANLIPKLSLFGGFTKYSEDKYGFNNLMIQPDRAYSYGLRLEQSYSIGGKEFMLYNITKDSLEKTRLDHSSIINDYLLNVAVAFYDALKAQRHVEIAKSNVQRLKRHKTAAEVRLKVGEVTKTAVLRAEAELSGAKTELIKAENNLQLAKAILSRLVGIEQDYELKASEKADSEEVVQFANTELLGLQTEAIAKRSEVHSALLQQKIADRQIKIAESAYYPSLSMEAVATKTGMNPESLSLVKESIYASIRLNFPLFEAGMRRAEVREAEARSRQALLLVEDVKRSVMIEVKRAYLELLTTKDTIKSLQDQLLFAQDNYNAVSRQFDNGLANSIDVIDANNLLVTSEQRLAETNYNLQLSLIRLKRAIGHRLHGSLR